jgi:hypothetical protein
MNPFKRVNPKRGKKTAISNGNFSVLPKTKKKLLA